MITAMTTEATVIPEWDLADRMRKALRVGDLSTAEIAEYLGVSRQSVTNWIGGRVKPSTQTLRLWALRTGVSYEWLCAIRDSNPEPAGLEPLPAQVIPLRAAAFGSSDRRAGRGVELVAA